MKLFKRGKKKTKTRVCVIQPKRKPVKNSKWRIFHARTKRRHRAATAGAIEEDGPNVGVVRALVIILGLHIVAIAGYFYHNSVFEKSGAGAHASFAKKVDPVDKPSETPAKKPARFVAGDAAYVVVKGDDYAKIADHYGIDEEELRLANLNVQLRPGRILRIPSVQEGLSDDLANAEAGVPALPPAVASRDARVPAGTAVLVKPKALRAKVVAPPSGSRTYVVKPGDSVWGISHEFKVPQKTLMKANGISDPRKLKVGMRLKIPK